MCCLAAFPTFRIRCHLFFNTSPIVALSLLEERPDELRSLVRCALRASI